MGENWCMPMMGFWKKRIISDWTKVASINVNLVFSRIVKIGYKSAGSEFGQTDFCNGFCWGGTCNMGSEKSIDW